MKALFAIPAALLLGGPAMAVDLDFGQNTLVRSEPYAVRACGDAFGPRTDVCYNQHVSGEVFPLSRGVGLEVDRYRTIRVRCELPRVGGTVRGNVARQYCPAAADGSLAPAPFLD